MLNSKVVQLTVLFIILSLSFSFTKAQVIDCPFLEPIQNSNLDFSKLNTVSERSNALIQEAQSRKKVFQSIFQDYSQNKIRIQDVYTCIKKSKNSELLFQSLQAEFFAGTLDSFKNSKSRYMKNLMEIYKNKSGGNQLLFQMLYKTEEQRAEFDRGSRAIFLNLAKLNRDEWRVLFLHELLHYLDEVIWDSMEVYAQTSWVEEFVQVSRQTSDVLKLPQETQTRLLKWIRSGLDRGLFAEYRAWYFTLKIYQQEVALGEWSKVQWVEERLKKITNSFNFEFSLYELLDQNFVLKKEGLFLNPLIQNAEAYVRLKIRQQQKPPSLGNLSQILN